MKLSEQNYIDSKRVSLYSIFTTTLSKQSFSRRDNLSHELRKVSS